MKDEKDDKNFERRNRYNSQSIGLGKLPPQAVDLEAGVLGALMLEREAIHEITEILKPESFYEPRNQKIYEAIITLFNKHTPVDILTVTDQLRKQGDLEMIGGAYYITELTNRVASGANIEFHAYIIKQKHLARTIIHDSTTFINDAYEDTQDVLELLDRMSVCISNAQEGIIGSSEIEISDIAAEVYKARDKPKTELSGLPTGIKSLDDIIDGCQPGQLIVIGARPAMGKTAAICTIAKNMNIDHKIPLAIFSLEMSYKQIYYRLESNTSGINATHIKKNKLSDQEKDVLTGTDGILSTGTLIIDDTSYITAAQICNRIAMFKRKYGIKAVLIDYLQLIQGESKGAGNREQDISAMTRKLKVTAKELGVPIILLAQLSRAVESRKPFFLPQLADLRESGSIEQDADIVIFLWRPEYYNIEAPTDFRLFGKTIDNKNLLSWIIAKHREGELGSVPTMFTPWNMRIFDHPDLNGIFSSKIEAGSVTDYSQPQKAQEDELEDLPF